MTRSILKAIAAAAAVSLAGSAAIAAEAPAAWKDTGPAGACDVHSKDSAAWRSCLGAARAAMPSNELFYAGYWLARSGKYEEALGYLSLADKTDARVLTYIGFATRKLGDVEAAMPYYSKALALQPGYNVARAYLGEAYLTKGEPAMAKAELNEIESRCGTACAEYAFLADAMARYEAQKG